MAAETLHSFIAEIKKSRYCLLPNLSEEDILRVWKVASEFVQRQMQLHKGVAIPGLGVFTFSQKKIDVGSNKFIVIQRPVFVLLEKFVQTHSLQYQKPHTSGQIPTVPLNLSVLSNETPFTRDTVESCIHEVIQSMSRLLASKGNIQLEFSGIGRLFIQETKVKMRFFREFITQLDSSGEMESAFRPGTAMTELSIMSDPTRPGTQALVLPRIIETSGSGNSLSLDMSSSPGPQSTVDEEVQSIQSEDVDREKEPAVKRKAQVLMETKNREVVFDSPMTESGKNSPMVPRQSSSSESRRLVPKPAALFTSQGNGGAIGHPSSSVPASPSKTERASRDDKDASDTQRVPLSSRPSTCSHSASPCQDLCYLCHQRALRNIPVDTSKDKREQEKVQDKLLLEYQQRRDLLALAKEQAARMKTIGFNRGMASFNLDAAQRSKASKLTKDSEFYPSYVFQQRALTPPRHIKQTHYCSELDNQVSYLNTKTREKRDKEEKEEREDQLQLAKELETYQEEFLKEKAAKVAHYQRALAEQIRMKPLSQVESKSIGGAASQQPVFGVQEVPMEKLREQREKARELFLEQLSMVAEKERKVKEKSQRARTEEAEMLTRTRRDLIDDIYAERLAKLNTRKSLEQSWNSSITDKQRRTVDEVSHSKQPSILLHQQCEKYHRCKQCQRRRENHGESNLLHESRYISGSRLMV